MNGENLPLWKTAKVINAACDGADFGGVVRRDFCGGFDSAIFAVTTGPVYRINGELVGDFGSLDKRGLLIFSLCPSEATKSTRHSAINNLRYEATSFPCFS